MERPQGRGNRVAHDKRMSNSLSSASGLLRQSLPRKDNSLLATAVSHANPEEPD
jgi:hypothetical protein